MWGKMTQNRFHRDILNYWYLKNNFFDIPIKGSKHFLEKEIKLPSYFLQQWLMPGEKIKHESKILYLIKLTFSYKSFRQIILKMQEFRKYYFKDLS